MFEYAKAVLASEIESLLNDNVPESLADYTNNKIKEIELAIKLLKEANNE